MRLECVTNALSSLRNGALTIAQVAASRALGHRLERVGASLLNYTPTTVVLSEQEWVDRRYRRSASGAVEVLSVQPVMRAWLRDYYQQFRMVRPGFAKLLEQASTHLREVTLGHPIHTLDWTVFDAALRALEHRDPVDALEWWRQVERRLAVIGDADLLMNLLAPLQSDDGAAGPGDGLKPPRSLLRSAVLATYAMPLLKRGRWQELDLAWLEVLQWSGRLPFMRATYRVRAAAGSVVAAYAQRASVPAPRPVLNWSPSSFSPKGEDVIDEALASGLIAAVEALVEEVERQVGDDSQPDVGLLVYHDRAGRARSLLPLVRQLSSTIIPQLQRAGVSSERRALLASFALALEARIAVLRRDYREARALFQQALAHAPEQGAVFSDWLAPAEPATRIKLELLRALTPAALTPSEAVVDIGSLPVTIKSADSDRLYTAVIGLLRTQGARDVDDVQAGRPNQSANGPSSPFAQAERLLQALIPRATEAGLGALADITLLPPDAPEVRPICNAHRALPPLIIAVQAELGLRGYIDVAYEPLGHFSAQTLGYDLDTVVRPAERALAELTRRYRLHEELPSLSHSLLTSELPGDLGLALSLVGLRSEMTPLPDPSAASEQLHVAWRGCYGMGSAAATAVDWARRALAPRVREIGREDRQLSSLLDAALWCDLREAFLLAQSERLALSDLRRRQPFQYFSELQGYDHIPHEVLRLVLRGEVLALGTTRKLREPLPLMLGKLSRQLGPGGAAAIALEEGELCMLRLPRHAAVLFGLAARWCQQAQDAAGAFIAATAQALLSLDLPRADLHTLVHSAQQQYLHLIQDPKGVSINRSFTLPSLESLERFVAEPQGWRREQLGQTLWRPWVLRLAVCLAARADGAGPPERCTALLDWLRTTYGPVLAADWQPLVARVAQVEQASAASDRERASTSVDRGALRRALCDGFAEQELRLFASELGIDYDQLTGADKVERSVALLRRIEREGRMAELVATLRRLRPNSSLTFPAVAQLAQPPAFVVVRDALRKHFDARELRVLCFDLGLDDVTLPSSQSELATALTKRLAAAGRLDELVAAIQRERPGLEWGAPESVRGGLEIASQSPTSLPPRARAELRQVLVESFDSAELQNLCYELGIADVIPLQRSKNIVAAEMILALERRGRLGALVNILKQRGGVQAQVLATIIGQTGANSQNVTGERAASAVSFAPAAASQDSVPVPDAAQLRRALERVSPDELEALAVDLGFDLDLITTLGTSHAERARELVEYMRRRRALPALAQAVEALLLPKDAQTAARRLTLRISPLDKRDEDSASPSAARPVLVSIRVNKRILYEGKITVSPQTPYALFTEELPVELKQVISATLAAANPDETLELRIEAPPSLHGACWEALFQTSPFNLLMRRKVQLHRMLSTPASQHFELLPGGAALVWAGDSLSTASAGRAWMKLPPRDDIQRLLELCLERSMPRTSRDWPAVNQLRGGFERIVVAHLVGKVHETNSGLRLQLGADETRRAQAPIKDGVPAGQLASGDLPRAFPRLSAVVLQAPPLLGSAQRVTGSRREAARLRAFAARVHNHGVPLVIVLPALPIALGEEMAAGVAHALAQAASSGRHWLADFSSVLAMLRETIVRHKAEDEAALDLCLFAPSDPEQTF